MSNIPDVVLTEPGQFQGVFNNGMEFLFPRSEAGPSLYALLEGAWMYAALIEGIRTKVWESDPLQPNPVAACWAKLGLLSVIAASHEGAEPVVILTDIGANVVSCAGLLEYEFGMMQQQLDKNYVTDPAKYKELRTGLDRYADCYLPEIRKWVADSAIDLTAAGAPKMFDFCGGDGGYLHHFLTQWPEGTGMLFDKAPGIDLKRATTNRMGIMSGDAFGQAEWFAEQAGQYDVVLLSEILHCKGFEDRAFLLLRAKSLLKPNGVLLVVEQFPTLRLEWRMMNMTPDGQCLSEQVVAAEAQAVGFTPISGIHSLSHYGICFQHFGA